MLKIKTIKIKTEIESAAEQIPDAVLSLDDILPQIKWPRKNLNTSQELGYILIKENF